MRKLTNGDRVGVKIIKDRVVLAAELLFVSELGDYNGVTLRLTLEEARQLHQELSKAIDTLTEQQSLSQPAEKNES
ncbi:MAG TPA: hypothetical protein VH186_25170 [Chloroflexia bacterium]|nr:hypothetical protein [Chloroflexia bacterium]